MPYVAPDPFAVPIPDYGVPPLPEGYTEEMLSNAAKRLDRAFPPIERNGLPGRNVVLMGDPKSHIIEFARGERSELIVMGTHGRSGGAHLMLGSVAERVIRAAPCPVLIVR